MRFSRASCGKNYGMVATPYPRVGFSFLTLLYFVAGGVVEATHNYWQQLHAIRPIVSALIATVLWPLILLGINLHIH